MASSNSKEAAKMLLNEKISIIRKMNNMTQEHFAEELGVSRQAVSKWENGTAVPDVQILIRLSDFYNLTMDQLIRDDFDLPMAKCDEEKLEGKEENISDFDIEKFLGKICDVSMNSFRYSVLRNVKIVGIYRNMVCFEKKSKYGYFNKDKSLGILVKKSESYIAQNEIVSGRCTVYSNKGTYFGGQTYAFSRIEKVGENGVEVHTGEFVTTVSFQELSVILMSDKRESKK
jgi:transcriptional regulator with XRE-family HTH domain